MAPGVQHSCPCIQALRYVIAPNHLGRGPTVPAVPFPHTGVAGGHQPRDGRRAVTPAILSTYTSNQARHSSYPSNRPMKWIFAFFIVGAASFASDFATGQAARLVIGQSSFT